MQTHAVFLLLIAQNYPAGNAHLEQAIAAKEKRDYPGYLSHLQEATKLGLDQPLVLYRLASAHALVGDAKSALSVFDRIADLGIALDLSGDPDLASLDLKRIEKRFADNLKPTHHSKPAFTMTEAQGAPEGLAYDAAKKRFLIGTIGTRKIWARDQKGVMTEVASEKDGLWAVLGMAIDAKRNVLWAATSVMEEPQDGALAKLDLATGKPLAKYVVPEDQKGHVLGDVVVASNGDAYTTDSVTAAIYRVKQGGGALELLLGGDLFRSLQGLCLSPDEKTLFVADYSRGVFAVDLAAKSAARLSSPPTATLMGIDGLYCHRGSLIATQNGVRPNRILRLSLGAGGRSIEKVTVLESNHPDFTEVTLGVIVEDALVYVAGPTKILRLSL